MTDKKKYLNQYIFNGVILLLFLFLWFRGTFISPCTPLFKQFLFLVFIVLGMTIELKSGVLDISCVAEVSMASYVGVYLLQQAFPLWLIVTCVVLFHLFSGAIRGILLAKLPVNPIIITFALQVIYTNVSPILFGQNILFTSGWHLYNLKVTWIVTFFIFLVVVALVQFILHKTYYGKYLTMIGIDQKMCTRSGLDTYHIRILISIFSSFLYSFSSLLFLLTVSRGNNLNIKFLYQAIAATCLGGSNLIDRTERITGSIFGTIIICILTLILMNYGLENQYENIIIGFIILFPILNSHKPTEIMMFK